MSVFSEYKSYKKYYPDYIEWKHNREVSDAKAMEFLKKNPSSINNEDIQRGKALLRAIDTMDEYSQKRAENMEVATESVISAAVECASMIGALIGLGLANKPFIKKIAGKIFKNPTKNKIMLLTTTAGTIAATTAAVIPLYSWAAKQEIKASKKGRFEAMRKELDNPKMFAVLTPEQEKVFNEKLKNMTAGKSSKELRKNNKGLKNTLDSIKEMTGETKEYLFQKMEFEKRLEEDKKYFDRPLTEKDIENAKKDKQILTKLVEKIDIASQDYAENIELATSTATTLIFGMGGLFSLLFAKLAQKLKLPPAIAGAPVVLSFAAMLGVSILSAYLQKEASRVGRYIVKRDLEAKPEELVYVDDESIETVKDFKLNQQDKKGMVKFFKEAVKNNREYKKWKKTNSIQEEATKKILNETEFSEEQIKDARRLQHNTFKTFNKIDENSQKYSESIEALGESIEAPISLIFSSIGLAFGLKFLKFSPKASAVEKMNGFMKYFISVVVSTLPAILINTFVTKEQKKASRVADMLAINELNDYRNFADYSVYRDA